MPAPIRSRTTSRWRSEKARTKSGSRARIFSSLNVVKPPTRAFSSAVSGRRAVPGTPTTRSPAPRRRAISAVSPVGQTIHRGNSASIGQLIDRQAAAYVPHEQHRVEVLGRGASVDPPLAPGAQLLDDAVELRPSLAQAVFAAAPRWSALDHADVLQMAKALGQQRSRDQRHSSPDVREAAASGEELAQDERGPPLGKDLPGNRDGTELAVSVHSGGTLRWTQPRANFIFWAFRV